MIEQIDRQVKENISNISGAIDKIVAESANNPQLLQGNIERFAKKCVHLAAANNAHPQSPVMNEGKVRSPNFVNMTLLKSGLAKLIAQTDTPLPERMDRMNHELKKAASHLEKAHPGITEKYKTLRKEGASL